MRTVDQNSRGDVYSWNNELNRNRASLHVCLETRPFLNGPASVSNGLRGRSDDALRRLQRRGLWCFSEVLCVYVGVYFAACLFIDSVSVQSFVSRSSPARASSDAYYAGVSPL